MTDDLLRRAELLGDILTTKGQDASAGVVAELMARIEALVKENAEFQQVFNMQWNAQMRAVEMWRKEHPNNALVLPDTSDLTMWLLNRAERLEAVVSFYASESLWDHDGGLDGMTPMERDKGHRARVTLGLVPDREDDLEGAKQ